MEFFYKKNNSTFDNCEIPNVENVQNYIPIYNRFFNLNNKNYNSINLNNRYTLKTITEKSTENKFNAEINDICDNVLSKSIFIKFSPLLDPIKYISSKYTVGDNFYNLPKLENNDCHQKLLDTNNSAYVDGFFSFLISVLLHNYNFMNGIDFYGSFLAIKNNFIINIEDDIDGLNDCPEFHSNRNKIYTIDNGNYEKLFNNSTKKNKNSIKFDDTEELPDDSLNLSNINDLNCLNEIFDLSLSTEPIPLLTEPTDINETEIIYETAHHSSTESLNDCVEDDGVEDDGVEDDGVNDGLSSPPLSSEGTTTSSKENNKKKKNITNDSGSSCSSRSSKTSDDDPNADSGSESESESSSNESSSSECDIFVNINKFPVQLIVLENCHNTLDDYIVNNKIRDNEWDSIVLQILFSLITYQKVFHFTHNDLHTNNIMYNNTDKKFIFYKFNNRHYKVPTFGKIYKLIDFGRAIYNFNGKLICSDSYHKDGDANSQYNFEPYFNSNKATLEPNYSFDLCRLGCSLFDFLIDELEDLKKVKSPIKKIILKWIIDDNNKNILYKNNGDERYPDFKLYKMIARTVHNHVPSKVLENPHFEKYLIAKKRINNIGHIINIDEIPIMI